MKNILYLIIAIAFFALAYYIWILASESGVADRAPASRGLSPRQIGPPPSELMQFIQQWQPVLSLVSSVGGVLSFIIQIRVWMRSRA